MNPIEKPRLGGNTQEQLEQIRRYLFRLVDQINMIMLELEREIKEVKDNGTEG